MLKHEQPLIENIEDVCQLPLIEHVDTRQIIFQFVAAFRNGGIEFAIQVLSYRRLVCVHAATHTASGCGMVGKGRPQMSALLRETNLPLRQSQSKAPPLR